MKTQMLKKVIKVSVGLMLFFVTVTVWALTPTEVAKLIASDGAFHDGFGYSVAVDGDTAVIGAWGDDDIGTNSGSAYVFVRSGMDWTQQAKLTASDGATFDRFGYSVAVDGDTAVIGAWGNDNNSTYLGSAYVFMRSGTGWTQQAKLTASDVADVYYSHFGASVAIHGDTAVIGAYQWEQSDSEPEPFVIVHSEAYVFVRNGTTWTQQDKLTTDDNVARDGFGIDVAVYDDTTVIGVPVDNENGPNSGSAYVFVRNGTTWTQQAKLTASDSVEYSGFGIDVAVYDDTTVIGANYYAEWDIGSTAVYVFVRNGTTWTQQDKPTASDEDLISFGRSVGLYGDTAVSGAPWDENGLAYVFVRSGLAWPQQARLTASDGEFNDHFGDSVAIHEDTIVIGAPSDDNENGVGSGSAYVFSLAEEVIDEHAAKLVCGLQRDPKNLRLVRGLYGTAINIHNPGEQSVKFKKKLALTFPPDEQKPGKVYDIAVDNLGPDQALEVDCMDIQRKLFPRGFPKAYIKGFVLIQSDSPLNVTAVYTAAGLDKKNRVTSVTSIDVEKITSTKQCPDLVVSEIGTPVVECRGFLWWRTCTTMVDYTITNTGNAAAGAFTVKAIFDPSQSVVVDQLVSDELAAGAEQSITISTPADGNCYDPDCTVSVTADSNKDIEECNETNNEKSVTTSG